MIQRNSAGYSGIQPDTQKNTLNIYSRARVQADLPSGETREEEINAESQVASYKERVKNMTMRRSYILLSVK